MDDKEREERRKCERCHFREHMVIDDTITCVSSDISENGLYVCMMQSLEEGQIIKIAIPFKGKKIILRARVQYSHPGIGAGLIFVDLNAEQRSTIRELMENIKK
jgi:hypothetical protein